MDDREHCSQLTIIQRRHGMAAMTLGRRRWMKAAGAATLATGAPTFTHARETDPFIDSAHGRGRDYLRG
jgi:hypothetical protein